MYNEEDTLSADQLFQVVLIDKKRKVKINIQLRDEYGDEVPLRETIEKLSEWVSDKAASDEANVCQQQIIPLMGQAMAGGMIKLMGPNMATVMLSQEHTRYSIMHMMTVGFYLLKWLQKKKINIHTFEESVTDEQIETYNRLSSATDLSVQAASMGIDPKEMIKEMLKTGRLKQSDLEKLGIDNNETEQDDKGTN